MSRSIWFLAAAALAFAVGCGDDGETDNNGGNDRVATILALEGDADAATSNYIQFCATCHGADGSGSPSGDNLQASDATDREAVEAIVFGQGTMAPYGSSFSDQEIADLNALVQSY